MHDDWLEGSTVKRHTLRAAAAALEISRPKLKRCIRDGLPAKRRGELYDIDLEAARAWIAEHEAPGAKAAPALDPRDPRHRERTAAAGIKNIKLALANGSLVQFDVVRARTADECTRFRTGLWNIRSQFGLDLLNATRDDAKRIIAKAIEDVLQVLKSDSPSMWPQPLPVAKDAEDDSWLEGDSRDLLPLLSPGDPRHDFALAAAKMREHAFAKMREEVMDLRDVLLCFKKSHVACRKLARTIPDLVAKDLSDGPNDQEFIFDRIQHHVYLVLCKLSHTKPESEAA